MTAPEGMSPEGIPPEGVTPKGITAGEPVDPDEVAEEAPIDPTPQEVDEYRELIGDPVPRSDDVPDVEPARESDPLPDDDPEPES